MNTNDQVMKYQDIIAIRRQLARAAKPYYNFTGPNDWSHISDVRNRARAMVRKLYGRGLTPEEYAAVLFHDCTKHDLGAENHGRTGAVRALGILRALLPEHEARTAAQAIAVHDDNLDVFPSTTAELLASADANPPDAEWVLNKSYNWQLRHGIADPVAGMMASVVPKYRSNGKFNYPGIYREFYGERLNNMQKLFDSLTPDQARDIVRAYRQRNGLSMDVPGQVSPTV